MAISFLRAWVERQSALVRRELFPCGSIFFDGFSDRAVIPLWEPMFLEIPPARFDELAQPFVSARDARNVDLLRGSNNKVSNESLISA